MSNIIFDKGINFKAGERVKLDRQSQHVQDLMAQGFGTIGTICFRSFRITGRNKNGQLLVDTCLWVCLDHGPENLILLYDSELILNYKNKKAA